MEKALADAAGATPDLWERLRSVGLGLKEVRERLTGDPIRARLSEPRVPGILDRLNQIAGTDWRTTTGPTATHRDSLAVAEGELTEAKAMLDRLLDTEIPELEQALNRAGAPWTPGRKPLL
jgi:hypothetical protein